MGIFSKFRTPSSSSLATSSNRPTTPAPLDQAPPRQRQTSSKQLPEPPTPRAAEKKGFGWKGKTKADVISGKPYEDQTAGLAGRRNGGKRITAIWAPAVGDVLDDIGQSVTPSSPGYNLASPTSPISPKSDRTIGSGSTERPLASNSSGQRRPLSNEFSQDGGVLGRLTFENKPRRDTAEREGQLRGERTPSWLAGSGDEGDYRLSFGSSPPSSFFPPSTSAPAFSGTGYRTDNDRAGKMETSVSQPQQTFSNFHSSTIPSLTDSPRQPEEPRRQPPFPPVHARKSSISQLQAVQNADGGSAIADRDQEEVSEGPGKKGKFWIARGRRASRAGEVEEAAKSVSRPGSTAPIQTLPPPVRTQPTSPTMRQSSLPVPPSQPTHSIPPTPVDSPPQPLPRARAQSPQLRRPSSSFFSNPFSRTTSRGPVLAELEVQPRGADDGSFQLKSFRHVSGMSDAMPLDSSAVIVDSPTVTSPIGVEERSTAEQWDLPPPIRPAISRPASSASVRTLDSQLADSPKVSVAAFKKGIRRPSETFPEGSKTADDDDDDVPLGVLNKGFKRAQSSLSIHDQLPSPDTSRAASQSVPPVKSAPSSFIPPTTTPRIDQISRPPSREPSPKPSIILASTNQGNKSIPRASHQRNGGGSGGFIVRGARSSRSTTSVDAPGRRNTVSPSPSALTPPSLPDKEEIVVSPTEGGSYFSPKNRLVETVVSVTPPTPVKSLPVMSERDTNLPSEEDATAEFRENKEQSYSTAQVIDLSNIVLPPRPDEISDEPMSHNRAKSPTQNNPSPTIQTPNRLSAFLGPASPGQAKGDGFDPTLVVNSMAVFAEETVAPSKSSIKSGRPSLQDRLGAVAASSGTKPIVAKIDASADSALGVTVKSPMSATTATPTIDSRPSSSFIKPVSGKNTSKSKSTGGKQEEYSSSSESEQESETRTSTGAGSSFRKPVGPRSPPVAARTITPLPSVPADDSAEDDSSSEEETLATVRAKASKSSLAVNNYSSPVVPVTRGLRSPSESHLNLDPPTPSARPSALGQRTSSNEIRSSFARSTSTPRIASPSLPPAKAGIPELGPKIGAKSLSPPGSTSALPPITPAPRRSPLSQSLSSTQLAKDSSYPATSASTSAQASASPASSQSGLTGDSVPQPMTPREQSTSGKGKERVIVHGRNESRDSQPWSNGGQISASASMASVSPSTEERQRRYSQISPPQVPIASYDQQQQQQMQMQANMDPVMLRNMMKQQWQAQFIAAAYQAAEEQWERASSAGAMSESGGQPMYPSFGMGMGMNGLPMPPQMSIPPYGYGYPTTPGGMPMQMPGFMPQNYGMPPMPYGYPAQTGGQGMYAYAPGSQSVYGADFGPPTQQPYPYLNPHQTPSSSPYHHSNPYTPIPGQHQSYQPSGPESHGQAFVSSPLAQTQEIPPSTGPTRPRHRANTRSVSGLPLIQNPAMGQQRNKDRSSSYHTSMSVSGSTPPSTTPMPPPTSWRRSGEWDQEATPRKARTGAHFAT